MNHSDENSAHSFTEGSDHSFIPKGISVETRNRVEEIFINRMINLRIKYKSKKFYEHQIEFFSGVMAALDAVPPDYAIYIMTGKEIVKEYKL